MKYWLAWLLGSMLLFACQHSDKPVEPVWGKQACDHCSMLLSQPRYAAELVTKDGKHLFFDDVGCMMSYVLVKKPEGARAWVHGEGKDWLDAKTTKYESGAKTPMDYGFVASDKGTLSFDQVQQAVQERLNRGGE